MLTIRCGQSLPDVAANLKHCRIRLFRQLEMPTTLYLDGKDYSAICGAGYWNRTAARAMPPIANPTDDDRIDCQRTHGEAAEGHAIIPPE